MQGVQSRAGFVSDSIPWESENRGMVTPVDIMGLFVNYPWRTWESTRFGIGVPRTGVVDGKEGGTHCGVA